MEESIESKAGAVALAGAPNVGKSTLLNQILGRRVSIATPKPQTTRSQVLGIHTDGAIQVLFVDTPGIHATKGIIHERMVRHARAGVRGADVVCWLVAADRGLRGVDRREIERLAEREPIVVVNKIDRVSREALLPIMADIATLAPGAAAVPISARDGDNVDELMVLIKQRMPDGPWLFPADSITDRPLRFLVAELVREQAFRQLDREIPYHVAVLTEIFEERGKTTYIEASLYTDSDSAKRIIVGKQGARIKTIGQAARKQIERLVDGKVYLDLHVRVKKGWQNDPRFLEELGM